MGLRGVGGSLGLGVGVWVGWGGLLCGLGGWVSFTRHCEERSNLYTSPKIASSCLLAMTKGLLAMTKGLLAMTNCNKIYPLCPASK